MSILRSDKVKRFNKIVCLVLVISFLLPFGSGLDRVAEASNASRINNRGLVFNTGVSSDNIRLIKDFFRARGNKNVPYGYDYDSKTKEMVRTYQKNNGLKADGIAGKGTTDKMNRDIANGRYSIGLRKPTVGQRGDLIIINKSSNTLHHMKNGKVYKSYPVATGKSSNLTPDGKHRVVVKYVNPAWGGGGSGKSIPGGAPNNPLGKRWIGISYGGGGKYGMHGTTNERSIGTYASAGCVRMLNRDVESFYKEVSIGTPVWIGSEDLLTRYGVKFQHEISTTTPTKPVKPKPTKPKEDYIVQKDVKVKLNGELVKLEGAILNNKGTTYYPFREILEKVGAEASWDGDTRTAIGELDGNKVEFKLDSNNYTVNGEKKTLPVGQKTFLSKDEKTYIPIRYAMEGLGFEVDWIQDTKTITIDRLESPDPEEPEEKPDEEKPNGKLVLPKDYEKSFDKESLIENLLDKNNTAKNLEKQKAYLDKNLDIKIVEANIKSDKKPLTLNFSYGSNVGGALDIKAVEDKTIIKVENLNHKEAWSKNIGSLIQINDNKYGEYNLYNIFYNESVKDYQTINKDTVLSNIIIIKYADGDFIKFKVDQKAGFEDYAKYDLFGKDQVGGK